MRHGDKKNNLTRTASHRKALLKNLSGAIILHKRIQTTLAKAKALRRHIEPIITKTKNISTDEILMHRQRLVFSLLQNEQATKELFTVVGPKVANRQGGYCRIIKLGRRKTDSAEMAYIELIDFNEVRAKKMVTDAEKTKQSRKSRTRRSGAKKTTAKQETSAPKSDSTVEK